MWVHNPNPTQVSTPAGLWELGYDVYCAGKHPVSALMEMCNKKKWPQPEFVMVHHSGPDHRKNFLFKVVVNGCDYQPQTASPNKKHAKAMAATVALQAMGEVAGDGVYTGPVFTAATST
ncbi:ribonuclease 3-like [Sinocyclocheilus rhinocerous]|uniref:ribonuclease 3-like n=1 Tax=Sinocyclocheilus rhinocerous TaxID=307959 RepID=UPI0007B9F631|nr:PREDICTED: ribonuclease 3-like [Sinocyclocheilus rhinocerous]